MRSLILIGLLWCSNMVFAQQKMVTGFLRDSVTHQPIVLASVTNSTTKKTVMTSNTGRFRIVLSSNDVLAFAAVGYYFDTIQYARNYLVADTLELQLSPLSRDLGNVTVTARGMNQYQRDSMERRRNILQDMGNYTIPAISAGNSGAGIAFNISRFSRYEKNKRKAFAFYEALEKDSYINYRFDQTLVKKFTGFKDDTLQEFMQQHRPGYEWLRAHPSEEDIKYYINDQLKEFSKR